MVNESETWKEENTKTPTLPKARRVGHPQESNQSLSVDVLEWYYPNCSSRDLKKHERWPTRPLAFRLLEGWGFWFALAIDLVYQLSLVAQLFAGYSPLFHLPFT